MVIYESYKAVPYVYKCIHKITGQFYFGYREYNTHLGKPSSEDFPLYKTSSKFVRANFECFDWIILAEFIDGDSALAFEQALIKEHWGDPLLLNKQYRLPNGDKKFKSNPAALRGIKKPAISESNRRRTPWNKGLNKSDSRVNSYASNREYTDDRRKALSDNMKLWHKKHSVSGENNPMFGKIRKIVECEHCHKEISDANYSRWHGAKCKLAP